MGGTKRKKVSVVDRSILKRKRERERERERGRERERERVIR